MKARAAAALLAFLAACRHTKEATPPEGKPAKATTAEQGGGIPPRAGRPPVPASPEALLGPREIAEVQRALAERGLLRGHAEGQLDAPTAAALQRFQRQEGLAATGFPDRDTVRRLGIDPEQAYRRGRRAAQEQGTGSGRGAEPDAGDRRGR